VRRPPFLLWVQSGSRIACALLKAYVASIKITNEAVTDLMSIITNRQSH